MDIDASSLWLACLIFASGFAPLHVLRRSESATAIILVMIMAGLLFMVLVEADYRFGAAKSYADLPIPSGGF